MKSRASVTVMVTWVCVNESSNIQSGWREGNVNLRETESVPSVHNANTNTLLRVLLRLMMSGEILAVYLNR